MKYLILIFGVIGIYLYSFTPPNDNWTGIARYLKGECFLSDSSATIDNDTSIFNYECSYRNLILQVIDDDTSDFTDYIKIQLIDTCISENSQVFLNYQFTNYANYFSTYGYLGISRLVDDTACFVFYVNDSIEINFKIHLRINN